MSHNPQILKPGPISNSTPLRFSKFLPLNTIKNEDYTSSSISSAVNVDLSRNKRFVDILENKRLYAANFLELNDMFESLYRLYIDPNTEKISDIASLIENNFHQKSRYRICSFCRMSNEYSQAEHLMWAHYANSHRGVRIDFELPENFRPMIYKVLYIKQKQIPVFKDITQNDILRVFTQKIKAWQYEKEYRIVASEEECDTNLFTKINDDRKTKFYVNGIKIISITLGRALMPLNYDYESHGYFPENIRRLARDICCAAGCHIPVYAYTKMVSNKILQVNK